MWQIIGLSQSEKQARLCIEGGPIAGADEGG